MKRLISILICALPAYADPPFLPIAICNAGQCVMAEADFIKFQQFHVATHEAVLEMQKDADKQEKLIEDLSAKLNRTVFCQLRAI